MSKHHLRKDTTCQNCNATVLTRFCGNCGQENTETRQSFSHLVRHFAEDVTHYDSSFWKTIKYLLLRPAFLTKEFLKGKRSSYVPPVRLYIFISFVTFFLPYLLPEASSEKEHEPLVKDTMEVRSRDRSIGFQYGEIVVPNQYSSVKQLDSAQMALPESERMGPVEYWMEKRYIHINTYSGEQVTEKFQESFIHNIPKGLFIYMPLFALVLWLFQKKKRWFYFDHAIFTLHYFSFMLLLYDLMSILTEIVYFINKDVLDNTVITILFLLGYFVYFVMAIKRMYEQNWFISLVKSFLIYGVNVLLFLFVLFALGLYTVLMIH